MANFMRRVCLNGVKLDSAGCAVIVETFDSDESQDCCNAEAPKLVLTSDLRQNRASIVAIWTQPVCVSVVRDLILKPDNGEKSRERGHFGQVSSAAFEANAITEHQIRLNLIEQGFRRDQFQFSNARAQ